MKAWDSFARRPGVAIAQPRDLMQRLPYESRRLRAERTPVLACLVANSLCRARHNGSAVDDDEFQQCLLLVENDDLLREVMCSFLEAEGFVIVAVPNGRVALAWLDANDVDGIILDLVMPVLDGWEFLTRRARSERLRALPVLVYTGSLSLGLLPKDVRVVSKGELPSALARSVREHFGAAVRTH